MQLQDYLIKYWEIVIFLALIAFYGLWAYFKVDNHEKRISKLEDGSDETKKTVSTMFEKIGAMDAKLDLLVEGYKKDRER